MGAVLEVEGVVKRYGAKLAVDRVSFAVAAGECLGVIGPNGAGKTTLFNLLDGSVSADAGSVVLDGTEIGRLPQYRRARMGIGRAFQVPRPFAGLTVFENVLVGAMHDPAASVASARRRALAVLEEVGLSDRLDMPAGRLPLLDRKRLELAKAISIGSKALLLDEIAGGLTELEVLELIEVVKSLKTGRAVIWIEHIPHALVAAADRIMVLHFGAKLIEGGCAEVMASPLVQEVYLGIAVDDAAHA